MSLIMERTRAHDCPIIVCDICQQRILAAADGNYEWLTTDQGKICSPLYFTHKRCSLRFERLMQRQHPEALICNMELAYFPIYLGNNLKLDWKEAREGAALMSREFV